MKIISNFRSAAAFVLFRKEALINLRKLTSFLKHLYQLMKMSIFPHMYMDYNPGQNVCKKVKNSTKTEQDLKTLHNDWPLLLTFLFWRGNWALVIYLHPIFSFFIFPYFLIFRKTVVVRQLLRQFIYKVFTLDINSGSIVAKRTCINTLYVVKFRNIMPGFAVTFLHYFADLNFLFEILLVTSFSSSS